MEQNTYAGVLPLALAAMVIFHNVRRGSSSRRSLVLFFALMAVGCLGIALRLPLLNAVNYLPLFNIAANGRMRLIYIFAVAILAGPGLDEISSGHRSPRRTTLRIHMLLALISLFLIVLAYVGFAVFKDKVICAGRDFVEANWGMPYLSRPLEYYYALVEERYEKKLALFRPSHIVMYLPVLIALSWFALHRWDQRQHIGTKVWSYTALSLALLDLFLVGMPFNPIMIPRQIFPTPGAIQFLKQDHDIYRVSGTDLILNPNKRVVLEEMPAGWTEPLEVPDSTTNVQIIDCQPNQIRLRVETAADGLLVLTDTYAPGWKALLDGHLAPVFVADHAFRAIGVPTGTHQIEFVYEPWGFRVGAMVSLVTMAALALVPLIARIGCARCSGQ